MADNITLTATVQRVYITRGTYSHTHIYILYTLWRRFCVKEIDRYRKCIICTAQHSIPLNLQVVCIRFNEVLILLSFLQI